MFKWFSSKKSKSITYKIHHRYIDYIDLENSVYRSLTRQGVSLGKASKMARDYIDNMFSTLTHGIKKQDINNYIVSDEGDSLVLFKKTNMAIPIKRELNVNISAVEEDGGN